MTDLISVDGDQDTSLDYNFNSEFARSLSFDVTKYDNDISKNNECNETIFKCESIPELSRSKDNVNKSDEDKQKQLWNDTKNVKHDQIFNLNSEYCDSNDAEIVRLRKECQLLLEENRKLTSTKSENYQNNQQFSIEKTRIETLEWQLRQAEKMNQMCLKLLTEVAHFLGNNFENQLNENCIERSKSISHFFNDKASNISRKNFNDTLKNRYRTRSISNLNNNISLTSRPKAFFSELSFKDLAWKIPLKNKFELPVLEPSPSSEEVETERISKDAYRILRLVRNTINSMHTINHSTEDSTTPKEMTCLKKKGSEQTAIHSIRTDEESHRKHIIKNSALSTKRLSTSENESGFSSICSYFIPSINEIGLPLNSFNNSEVSFNNGTQSEQVNVLWV